MADSDAAQAPKGSTTLARESAGLSFRPGPRDVLACLLLVAFCGLMYLPRLSQRGPWTAGEARAVLTPRVMLDRGEWVAMRMPTWELLVRDDRGFPIIDDVHRGRALSEQLLPLVQTAPDGTVRPRDFPLEQQITIHKPVGYYWVIAALGRLGIPVDVTLARLTSAVSATLTVVLVYLLGAYLFSRRAGLLAAVALAGSVHFVWIARVAKMDMVVTLLMTAALGLFYVAHRSRHNVLASLGMYVAMAAGVLIKGPGYLGIPALVIIVYLVVEYVMFRPEGGFWRFTWRQMCQLYVGPGIIIVLALAAPWYWLIYLKTGGQWTEVMFLRHHLARFGIYEYGKEFEAKTTPLYYLGIIWPLLFPWVIFLPGALVEVFRRRSRDVFRHSLFALTWFGFMLAFFSAMKFRKDEYLMPAYPAVMLLVGLFLDRYLRFSGRSASAPGTGRGLERAIRAAYVLVAVCAAGVAAFALAIGQPRVLDLICRLDDNRNTRTALEVLHRFVGEHEWAVASFGGLAVVLAGSALWAQFTGRRRLALTVLAGSAALLTSGTIQVLMDRIDPYRTQRVFAQQIERLARPAAGPGQVGDPIILFSVESHELNYWLDQDSRVRFGRPGAWRTCEIGSVLPQSSRGWLARLWSGLRLAGHDDDGLSVLVAQCQWWTSQGATPYLVTEPQTMWELLAYRKSGRVFQPVLMPEQVSPEYPRHRMPLVVLRFVPDR